MQTILPTIGVVIDFDRILLEPEQTELLARFVEAVRSVPSGRRQPVLVIQHMGGTDAIHPGWQPGTPVYIGDLEMLGRRGLLHLTWPDRYTTKVEVTPEGFAYYAELKKRSGQPVERQTTAVKNYLDSVAFKTRHAACYAKWAEAEQSLWVSDSAAQLTTIGHKCREAMQMFATDLINRYQPTGAPSDSTKTINRLKAVLDQQKSQLGESESKFHDALANYWEALNGLVQRQEHSQTLTWEDGRRVVFQTAVVMFEIDRSLK